MSLTVGHITYLNCVPFFRHLKESGFDGRILGGTPSELNGLLASGDVDLSISSSYEYARSWRDYTLLPGFSISSRGPVRSVLLFSDHPLEKLSGQTIYLTGESATSVHLLRLIFCEFVAGPPPKFLVPKEPVEDLIDQGHPALLIGDRAMKQAHRGSVASIDLAQCWQQFTGLPFVFALWIVRSDVAVKKRAQLEQFRGQLQQSLDLAFSDLVALAGERLESQWYGEEALVDYWRAMAYDLDTDLLSGLSLYYRLLVKHNFLIELPEISFLS